MSDQRWDNLYGFCTSVIKKMSSGYFTPREDLEDLATMAACAAYTKPEIENKLYVYAICKYTFIDYLNIKRRKPYTISFEEIGDYLEDFDLDCLEELGRDELYVNLHEAKQALLYLISIEMNMMNTKTKAYYVFKALTAYLLNITHIEDVIDIPWEPNEYSILMRSNLLQKYKNLDKAELKNALPSSWFRPR